MNPYILRFRQWAEDKNSAAALMTTHPSNYPVAKWTGSCIIQDVTKGTVAGFYRHGKVHFR